MVLYCMGDTFQLNGRVFLWPYHTKKGVLLACAMAVNHHPSRLCNRHGLAYRAVAKSVLVGRAIPIAQIVPSVGRILTAAAPRAIDRAGERRSAVVQLDY